MASDLSHQTTFNSVISILETGRLMPSKMIHDKLKIDDIPGFIGNIEQNNVFFMMAKDPYMTVKNFYTNNYPILIFSRSLLLDRIFSLNVEWQYGIPPPEYRAMNVMGELDNPYPRSEFYDGTTMYPKELDEALIRFDERIYNRPIFEDDSYVGGHEIVVDGDVDVSKYLIKIILPGKESINPLGIIKRILESYPNVEIIVDIQPDYKYFTRLGEYSLKFQDSVFELHNYTRDRGRTKLPIYPNEVLKPPNKALKTPQDIINKMQKIIDKKALIKQKKIDTIMKAEKKAIIRRADIVEKRIIKRNLKKSLKLQKKGISRNNTVKNSENIII